ncbi:hypothetical protein Natpe_3611 [Natrinema pellirubrum DSM 15624]|uniref:Uncharacterized protein n=1 Tax=Natrinema pellirubrum (strain DSM 15624 / CIP 106293 / JCM 10476 / NCIMB 786 / 157) TaxID=797303 RepID=L0JRE3_NATP1|nr:hypothetical protein [Natrinema pellirubrum]AGB33378.1 hypothetical protein Natpe_3611 [Natrinema pellirubrum DSM 15624]
MNRRKFIASTGGIGTAAIGTAVVLSGSAAAEIGDYRFTGTSISGESDDGSLSDIRAGATNVVFQYEGLDEDPGEATVELQVVHGGNAATIDEATTSVSGTSQSDVSLGEDLSGSVLDHDGLSASDFRAEEDGSVTEKNVALRLKVTVNDVSGSSETDLNVVMRNAAADAGIGGEADGEVVTEEEDEDPGDDGPVAEINAIIEDINAELANVEPVGTIDDTDDETIGALIEEIFTQVTAEIEAQAGVEYDVSTPAEAREAAEEATLPPIADALNNAADAVEEIAAIADYTIDDGGDDGGDDEPVAEINAIIEDINAQLENVEPVGTIEDTDDATIGALIEEIFTQVTAEIEAQAGVEYDVSTPAEAREAAEEATLPPIADALNNAADAVEEIAAIADYTIDDGGDGDDGDGENGDSETVAEINGIVEDINAQLENVESVGTIDSTDPETIDALVDEIFTQVTAEIEAQAGVEYDVSTVEEARAAAEEAMLPPIADALNNAADAVEDIRNLASQ